MQLGLVTQLGDGNAVGVGDTTRGDDAAKAGDANRVAMQLATGYAARGGNTNVVTQLGLAMQPRQQCSRDKLCNRDRLGLRA